MIFMETIRIQYPEIQTESMKKKFWPLVQKELERSNCQEYKIFYRAERSGEAMVMIYWDRENFDPKGSRISHTLISEIKKYGLLDYCTWINMFPTIVKRKENKL